MTKNININLSEIEFLIRLFNIALSIIRLIKVDLKNLIYLNHWKRILNHKIAIIKFLINCY